MLENSAYQGLHNKMDVPETFNIVSLHIDEHANSTGDKIALRSPFQTLTYKELAQEIARNGNVLLSSGVKHRDRIILALPDTPQVANLFLAAIKIGAVPAIVNPSSNPAEMKYFVEKTEAKFLVTSVRTSQILMEREPGLNDNTTIMTVDGQSYDSVDYRRELESASANLETMPTHRNDPAYVVFSSGTTGNPKAVLHFHKDLVYTVYPFLNEVMHATSDDVYYSGSRLFFSAGRMFSLHLPLMSGASTVLIPERPTVEIITDTLARYKPTVFLAIPSLYNSLIRAKESGDIALNASSLRLCLSGGEPLPPIVFQKWKQLTNKEIISAIGSSEAEWHFISQFQGEVRPQSSGRVVPGWQVKLMDEQGKQVTQPQTPGTAWIKSGSIAAGYVNDQENTAKKFIDGWFITDDVFCFDDEGYYYYVGRNDSLFKVKGRWVSPVEIEKVLLEYPSVSECIAFCVKDNEGLNGVRALVVLKGNQKKKHEELAKEILEFVSSHLPRYKTPRDVGFVNSLERTSNGKLRRTNPISDSSKVELFSLPKKQNPSTPAE